MFTFLSQNYSLVNFWLFSHTKFFQILIYVFSVLVALILSFTCQCKLDLFFYAWVMFVVIDSVVVVFENNSDSPL